MSYITQADIVVAVQGEARLKRIQRSTTINTDQVASAIEFATTTIDSYAQGSTGFPWTTVPDQAVQVSLALAIWKLYHLNWPAKNIEEPVEHGYTEAMKMLELLQSGKSSWVEGSDPAQQNTSKVFTYLPGDTVSDDNRRVARWDTLRRLL